MYWAVAHSRPRPGGHWLDKRVQVRSIGTKILFSRLSSRAETYKCQIVSTLSVMDDLPPVGGRMTIPVWTSRAGRRPKRLRGGCRTSLQKRDHRGS